jgi:membrane fusion protein (multidrug efflux system)
MALSNPIFYRLAGLSTLSLGLTLFFVGCGKATPELTAPPPVPVKVMMTQPETISVENTHLGRVAASNSVQVRARIQGIVKETHFTEGTAVEAGDLLFSIESDTYLAALNQAKAQLASVQAEADRAAAFEQRMARLIDSDAISQQDYDNAASAATQAAAAVTAAQSVAERAQLDLNYTQIHAPASGRIGRSLVSDGALVGKDGPTHLATIDTIDPIYVNFTISDLDGISIRREIESGALSDDGSRGRVQVILPDGSAYDHPARVDFRERLIDPNTGTITIRAVAENPETRLLPGMFVRSTLTVGQRAGVILLPQRAVIKMPTGHIAWVVVDGKAERRDLVMGEWYGDRWIVEKGIGPGEAVIVDGVQGLTPGRSVTPSPVAP